MQNMHRLFIIVVLAVPIFLMSIANADGAKVPTYTAKVGEQKKIAFTLTINQGIEQPSGYIIKVMNEEGFTDQVSWIVGNFQEDQEFRINQSWMPEEPGKYTVEIFVLGNYDEGSSHPAPTPQSMIVNVEP